MMTLALKVIAMFVLGMGTLILESVLLVYGWMSAYLALVTGGFIILSNIKKIKKKYFDTIKSLHKHKFNNKRAICSANSL